MNRREFIGSAALVALGPFAGQLLSGCTSDDRVPDTALQAISRHEMQTLFAVARALFPHKNAPEQPYLDVVSALDAAATKNVDVENLLRSAVNELDSAAGGDWLSATVERKLQILEEHQGAPYFGLVLNTAIDTIYRNPDIWASLGYGGSSLEQGGYLHRGFDDISWLPNQQSETSE